MVRFRMLRISTTQFAILAKEAVEQYRIQTNVELKMVLQVLCEFGIHPDDVQTLTLDGKVTIPKNIVDYFIAQTVGTARGILHCKTEGTSFNGIIIPPMDVTNIVESDMVIELDKE